ncbi:hypothetical protein JOF56_000966 [Kibdelosporangium banguiense]|uniref:DUF4367 domain-containing protein n=1 Tax=Kibdelosporangium banguiense TaxID=1365924 RepID=A0ABS4T828_9PSEU|nr:hypothetical protein [Kibdelosporangium banguiense]MBP2320581.1 hypothetical protein [Kibdelosporangium banguiense]
MSDDLEAALRSLGTQIEIPDPPDVAASVRKRIAQKQKRQILRPVLIGLLALLLAGAVAFAVSPDVRAGVARFFGFAGVEFRQDSPPPLPVTPLMPGERVISLDEAKDKFGVRVPTALGAPKEVRVVDGRVVSLIYDDLRLDEFDGEFGPAMGKFAQAEELERVRVNDTDALWIPRPHELFYIDRTGAWKRESARMSGKTLIWQAGPKTMRLEGDLTKQEAIKIASS